MSKYWIVSVVLVVAATGCTSGGFSAGHTVAQQQPPQPQLAQSQQNPSLTQRVTSSITSVIPGMDKKEPAPSNALSPEQAKLDPIALGFKSGPPSAELYLSMAQLSDRGGNVSHARSMYQKALIQEPNHLDSLLGLARLEDREGRMHDALRIYQQAAAAHPQNAKVLNDLALCYARSGQLPASAQLLDQATRLQPQKKLYRNNFAKVLIELNQIDGAVAQLSTVHQPAIVHYNMGVLLSQRGRTDEAVRFLTAATHINPQMQEAKTLLVQISGDANLVAASANSPVNDGVLPTPMAPTAQAAGQPYPATAAPTQPTFQTVPAETAQVPVGESPSQLPPVR